jgi:DNA-binding transcriptional LysR family regulator
MKNLELIGLEVFISVARAGSVRGAARELGITPSVVSRRLGILERQLGVVLFLRNNRSFCLTEVGERLFKSATPGFDVLRDAVRDAGATGHSRSGLLKISLPWSAYKIIVAPTLQEFRATYPEINLQFSFEEGLIDIVQQGFHAGFRLGDRLSQGMVAKKMTPHLRAAYFASDHYLSRFGLPQHPNDLAGHHCIRYRYIKANRLADWEFNDGTAKLIPVLGNELVFDTFQAVIEAAVAGHGIGWALRSVVADYVARGELITVLENFAITHPPFFFYYPKQLKKYQPLRLFLDFITSKTTR